MAFSSSRPAVPVLLSASTEAQVYLLFAFAMGLTAVGAFFGVALASALLATGAHFFLLILELAIIFTSGWWSRRTPWNYILFALFPLFSGITITPYILYVLLGYANGASILMNALASTTFLSAAAAVFARTTRINLGGLAQALLLGLLGLIVLGLLQVFFPALRSGQFELMLSGGGVLLFATFLAFDLQRIQQLGRAGANPFQLALSLYLDIFNLFLYVVRFMIALSGNRR
ncbi:MAG: Bax inhibitor-1 family protein [Patescibacteria group bacterium]